MSILIAKLSASEVFVASDTNAFEAFEVNEECTAKAQATKVIALPQYRMILGVRGNAAFLSCLFNIIQLLPVPTKDFDGLSPLIIGAVEQAYDMLLDAGGMSLSGTGAVFGMIFGWSAQQRRVAGGQFLNFSDAQGVEVVDAFRFEGLPDSYVFSPNVPQESMDRINRLLAKRAGVREMMIAIANAQRDNLAPIHKSAIGGQLILTTLNKICIDQRTIHEFPDFATQEGRAA